MGNKSKMLESNEVVVFLASMGLKSTLKWSPLYFFETSMS